MQVKSFEPSQVLQCRSSLIIHANLEKIRSQIIYGSFNILATYLHSNYSNWNNDSNPFELFEKQQVSHFIENYSINPGSYKNKMNR